MRVSVVTPYLAGEPDHPRVDADLRGWLDGLAEQAGPLELILAGTAPRRHDPFGPRLRALTPAGYPHPIRVIHAPYDPPDRPPASRAAALRAGGALATGELLVLLHIDCRLPAAALGDLRAARRAGYRAGAFPKVYRPRVPLLALQERWLNGWRLRRGRHTVGTNAVWLERGLWAEEPLPDVPFLEDFALSVWLRRRLGPAGIWIGTRPVEVDAAKYLAYGPLASIATNAAVIALHRLAEVPPEVLKDELYSRRRLAVGRPWFGLSLAAAMGRAVRARRRRR